MVLSPLFASLVAATLLVTSPDASAESPALPPVTAPTNHAEMSETSKQAPPPKELAHERSDAGESSEASTGKDHISPQVLDDFQTAQSLCQSLKELSEVPFEVVVSEEPTEKKPQGKAAQQRWQERQKEIQAKRHADELQRLHTEYVHRRQSQKAQKWVSVLPWREFSDLLDVMTHEVEEIIEYEVFVAPPKSVAETENGALRAENVSSSPCPQVCVDGQIGENPSSVPVTEIHRKKRRTTQVDAVEISLGRVFSLFDGQMKLFDLDKSSLILVPTESGHQDEALQQALRRGSLTLKILWSPTPLEQAPCAEEQGGKLFLSAKFIQASLVSENDVLAKTATTLSTPEK